MSDGRAKAGPGVERTASGLPRLPALDGFRALALLGVVTFHLLGASGAASSFGYSGKLLLWGVLGNVVDGFFVISGFGLFLPVVAARGEIGDLGRWAIRRGARILPAYWLTIAVVLVLLALVPSGLAFPSGWDIAINVAVLEWPAKLFNAEYPVGFVVDGPLWMVSVIVGFYVVFPFIARSYYRHPLAGLAVAAAVTFAWREAALHATAAFDWIESGPAPLWLTELVVTDQLPGFAFSFALGMTGAWLYYGLMDRREEQSIQRRAALLAGAGLVACAICAYLYARQATQSAGPLGGNFARSLPLLVLAYSASRAALMAGIAMGPSWMRAPFANRPLGRIAPLSYAVYLIHGPIIYFVCGAWLHLPFDGALKTVLAWFAIDLSIAFAYALVSRRFVERPAIEWAQRVTGSRPEKAPPIPATPASSPP